MSNELKMSGFGDGERLQAEPQRHEGARRMSEPRLGEICWIERKKDKGNQSTFSLPHP